MFCLLIQALFLYSISTYTNALEFDKRLTDQVKSYEVLNYNLRAQRHVRSASKDSVLRWEFSAFGKTFPVVLMYDTRTLADDVMVDVGGANVIHGLTLVEGHVKGERGSRVNGILLSDGTFEGQIATGSETYFVEHSNKFTKTTVPRAHSTSSIIYRQSDLHHMPNSTTCKSSNIDQHVPQGHTFERNNRFDSEDWHDINLEDMSLINGRWKRATDPNKIVCELFVQADVDYFNRFGNVELVIEDLAKHITSINGVFPSIDFDGDSSADNVQFIVKKIKVWTSVNEANYPFPDNYGVEKYLEVFSEQSNLDSFCLGITFTHRDFEGGTLGLAWTGSTGSIGGVCQKNLDYRGTLTSLNTNIVTTLNYGSEVLFSVSSITLAHEVGHNFGSPHDPATTVCAPGDANGNFIMYAKASDGSKPNNNKFSPCSIQSMNEVLNLKARDATNGCFQPYTGQICGNKVVEAGEECDCGWTEDCSETCCNPQTDAAGAPTPCTLKAGVVCSPSEGPCCNSNCLIASSGVCRNASSCLQDATCNGINTTCPDPPHKANGTECSVRGDLVCSKGVCSQHICEYLGLTTCQCTATDPQNIKDPNLCKLCCMQSGECKLSQDIPAIGKEVYLSPGHTCFDFNGFCDDFNICRDYDPEGTLAGLKNLFFSEEGINKIKDWLVNNWWIPVVGFVAFIIVMALFVKFCGVRHGEKGGPIRVTPAPVTPAPI